MGCFPRLFCILVWFQHVVLGLIFGFEFEFVFVVLVFELEFVFVVLVFGLL